MEEPFDDRHPLLAWLGRVMQMYWLAINRFFEIDGEQRAASFGYYAFFALFPLVLLFVTVGSQFLDANTVADYIMENLTSYLPFSPSDRDLVERTLHSIIAARGRVSALAFLGLFWSSTHFFHAMVRGVNRAWGTVEYPWWRLPMQSMIMLGLVASALLIGVLAPVVLSSLQRLTILHSDLFSGLFRYVALLLPTVVLFYVLTLFYKFAPRRPTRITEVVIPALTVTVLLQVCRFLFERYAYGISNFNAVYGAVAIIIILLMWIYLSGVIIIFGGCLCAAQAQIFARPLPPLVDIAEEFGEGNEPP